MSHSNKAASSRSNPLMGFHIRNLLTYLVVISAMTGIVLAARQSEFKGVLGYLLAVAILADCFDGKFSRLFKGASSLQQQMGAELDSLADFLAFGVFPALVLIFNLMRANLTSLEAALILAASLWYLLCVFHRLAFFNVSDGGDRYFIGIPSPLGALLINFAWSIFDIRMLAAIYCLCGYLMVSNIKIVRPKLRGMLFLVFLIGFSALLHAYLS